MSRDNGSWTPSDSTVSKAKKVLDATASSGELYRNGLGMIASENIVSPMVQKIVASDLHGRYAEGLPGRRYYQGCDDFDTIESLGIELARSVFNAPFANIQSTSGTVSNIAALKALAKPGDKITAVSTADGGHISHARMGAVGLRDLDLSTYPWDEDRMEPDIDGACALIREIQPKVSLIGQSVFLFPTPLREIADAAHEVGSTVMYDGAHVLGLIAGGVFQDPLREGADVMTGSSHKTFPGPQGGFLLSSSEDEKMHKRLNNAIFPGVCSSYHLHHVAGKVVALAEFEEYGQSYAENIVKNAQSFAQALAAEGFDVLAESRNYTASHQVLTRHGGTDSGAGAKAADLLEQAGIITNMNMLPGDTKALSPSGLRLGVQELTRVGMGTNEMQEVASLYARVLLKNENPSLVKEDVKNLKSNFQIIRYCFNESNQSGYPL
ncbi:MAG: serine hydroxymethyltransferase [Candidatus Poseidoniaceae archaeon]|nr:serine hydroxymethyltransferase [Euryarchaeota archaeon]MAU75047.1 serine hydroxymethyltransferase [Euryarchaeota archaeon]MBL6890765.1 serine hydroxymethyltransferase [Candidatus Poseidoniaceae archaeon]RAH07530.1 MAG: serine hydroxymethyltransferase [Euryarchaeota archaeon TMED132]RAH07689.1 MAG: serine hydroxymethyltransferase [Euryarchaeota archaeon TMED132]|tara:strand:+ start:8985 stop:10298 length:1314 start_codon:yes stop_codon:yes gene_type:complete